MSPILSGDERRKLRRILVGILGRDPYNTGYMLVKEAGLEDIVSGIDLFSPGPVLAKELIACLENYGPLPDRLGTYALGALLRRLITPELEWIDASFIARLIVEHRLIGDDYYLSELRAEYVGIPTMFGGDKGILFPRAADDESETKGPSPRYTNVDLVDHTTSERCDDAKPLAPDTEYHLRIDIGTWRETSVVKNVEAARVRTELMESERSDKGYWLDVIVTSEDFEVKHKQHALFLPEEGASWVCDCPRDDDVEHRCDKRDSYLYVSVTSPAVTGEATLRIGFYFKNNLLQCHLFTARIGTLVPDDKAGYDSVVDYTLTHSLRDVKDRFPARTLNLFTNENADGSHRFVLVGGERIHHRSLSDTAVGDVIGAARKELHDTHRKLIREAVIKELADGTKVVVAPANYENLLKTLNGVPNSKSRDDFVADLKRLAGLGATLWEVLFQGWPDSRRKLRELLDQQAVIQVARSEGSHSPLLFPWALVYDISLDTDPSKWNVCKLLSDWKPGKALADPNATKCPHDNGENHTMDLICPFGFWGFKHILEQPPSMPAGRDLSLEITLSNGHPELAVAYNLDETLGSEDHIKKLKEKLSELQITAKASKDDILGMLGNTDLELVYFFCHGRRAKLPGAAQQVPYLEVGQNEPMTTRDITKWQDNLWSVDHWKKTSPLVFINGCHTAELTPDSLVSFVDKFIEVNAGGVIGTEVTVHRDLASEAALLFFSALVEKNEAVGHAIRHLRLEFLSRGNLMGLAYTPYCSAELHLKK